MTKRKCDICGRERHGAAEYVPRAILHAKVAEKTTVIYVKYAVPL